MAMIATVERTVHFTSVPNLGTETKPFITVVTDPRRFFLLGGTVSNNQMSPATAWIRVEIRAAGALPSAPSIWTSDVLVLLEAGQQNVPVGVVSGFKLDLQAGAYDLRLTCKDAARLSNTDVFFVVAIDMDDDVDPHGHTKPGPHRATAAGAAKPKSR